MPEAPDPNKYHVLSESKMRLFTILAIFFAVVILPILAFAYYKIAIQRPAQFTDEKQITIESGTSVSEIAQYLYEESVVNSAFLFKMYVTINSLQDNIQAGTYTVPAGVSAAELANLLQHGRDDKIITFLEGWRVEEYAKRAHEDFPKVDYNEFVRQAKQYEGYLFPDTYSFSREITEEQIIETLRNNFDKKTDGILTDSAIAKAGLTKEEIIIVASVVEREMNIAEDKPTVAGILINRLRNNELLGADATTQYAIAPLRYGCAPEQSDVCPDAEYIPEIVWWPDDLTVAELQNPSPFNTRAVAGLPPRPIANPGLESIQAVLNFEITPYNYYISGEDGNTYFAETLEEHNLNIQKYGLN